MTMHTGDYYRCPDTGCGCEIDVTKGAATGGGGDLPPRCCCGKNMELVNKVAAEGAEAAEVSAETRLRHYEAQPTGLHFDGLDKTNI